ncbi:hypothetical protein AB0K14_28065 [Actinosynnema sp. NPDC050801]|uniref:hypothetical protein n=1 Tax=unclassified Actinosynnema TaxID=2637065 RepID=UPI0033D12365
MSTWMRRVRRRGTIAVPELVCGEVDPLFRSWRGEVLAPFLLLVVFGMWCSCLWRGKPSRDGALARKRLVGGPAGGGAL